MTPSYGKHFPLLFLPATQSSVSRTPGGLFELTQHPLRALPLPQMMFLELKRIKDSIWYALLGTEVPGLCQKQQTLIVCL